MNRYRPACNAPERFRSKGWWSDQARLAPAEGIEPEWLCPQCWALLSTGRVGDGGATFIHAMRNAMRDQYLELMVLARVVEQMLVEESSGDAEAELRRRRAS